MPTKPLPTPEQLRELLRYEPDTGRLFWKVAPAKLFTDSQYSAERKCSAWNSKYAGKEALAHHDTPHGYAYGDIFGTKAYAHRVILAIINGSWPEGDVDHISGDKTDNREANLRAVTRGVNAMNRPLGSHNKSGAMGIYWDAARRKWAAEIFSGGAKKHLGRFETLNDAKAARAKAEVAMGYHPNHGRQPLTLTR